MHAPKWGVLKAFFSGRLAVPAVGREYARPILFLGTERSGRQPQTGPTYTSGRPMSYLTDAKKKQPCALIQEGKPLPAAYKGELFGPEDVAVIQATKEYRLVYEGKLKREEVLANTLAADTDAHNSRDSTDNAVVTDQELFPTRQIRTAEREARFEAFLGTNRRISPQVSANKNRVRNSENAVIQRGRRVSNPQPSDRQSGQGVL